MERMHLYYKGFTAKNIIIEDDGTATGEVENSGGDLIIFWGRNTKALEEDFRKQIDFYMKTKDKNFSEKL
jgi:hypothetical protein